MPRYSFLKNLKREFREWYGLLSCTEIIENHDLVDAITNIEQHHDFYGLAS